MSQFEEKIALILRKEKIDFVREKTFNDLRGGKYRFDFWLPQMQIAIECDGVHHYQQIKHFHKTKQSFTAAQERDRRKNSYCLAHNIPLYRIPYWDLENIKSLADILTETNLVETKWHNDNLRR